jgi:HK97 family phage major capsid protein
MTPLARKLEVKKEELKELSKRYDSGDRSAQLYSEMDLILSQIEAIERRGQETPRALTLESGDRSMRKTSGPFKTLGSQIRSIIRAGTPGEKVDRRLFEVAETRAATGLSEGIPSDGGFLLQDSFVNDLLMATFDEAQVANMCRKIPVTVGNTVKIPGLDETSRADGSRQGGIRSYWADEATEATASRPKFRQVNLTLHKLIGLVYLTDELMEDAPNLQSFIEQAFAREFSWRLDNEILRGAGAGSPLGVLNSGSLVTQTAEGGQTATTFVFENAVKMYSRLLGSEKKDAVWLINSDVLPQLMTMSLTVSSGGSAVFMPSGGASASPFATLFGKRVIECEQCSTLGSVGDVILGNFKQGYLLAEKNGIQSDMSIHVRFEHAENVLRFILRLDGTPVLSSVITPANGTATQSHFVVCATRS